MLGPGGEEITVNKVFNSILWESSPVLIQTCQTVTAECFGGQLKNVSSFQTVLHFDNTEFDSHFGRTEKRKAVAGEELKVKQDLLEQKKK